MKKQTQYISDGNYNYLRINYGEEGKGSYSYRMITENVIPGLLPCRMRTLNGDTYLYYEIQSKQALRSRYEVKEMDYETLKNLFYYLCTLGKELDKYLLDFKDIVFNENYVYQEVETGETFFLFLPNKDIKEDGYADFMEYIVKRIDHRDAKAVQISYRLYDLSRSDHISLEEAWNLFEGESRRSKNTENPVNEIWGSNNETGTETGSGIRQETAVQIKKQSEEQMGIYAEWKDIKDEEQEEKTIRKAKWKDSLVPLLAILIFMILFGVKISCSLTYEKKTLLLAGMAVDAAVAIIYTVHRVRNRKKGDKKESTGEKIQGKAVASIEGELEKKAESAKTDMGHQSEYFTLQGPKDAKEEIVYGETIFWEPEVENILYGTGKYEKLVIKLDKFPFTVGKIKDEADYILKDGSISRLHARFYQNEDNVYIMDLNSTNGTFKNGFRIPANQKVMLEEGDEIGFGKIRFYYR